MGRRHHHHHHEDEEEEGEEGEQGNIGMKDLIEQTLDPENMKKFREEFISRRKQHLSELSPEQMVLLEGLKKVQENIDKYESAFEAELEALDKKYKVLKEPELKKISEAARGDNGLPNYWYHVLMNHGVFASYLEEGDEEPLKFLIGLRSVDYKDKVGNEGFSIEFYFNENPYFTNNVLVKTVYFEKTKKKLGEKTDAGSQEDDVTPRPSGTTIDWKPGKNLTVKTTTKKKKNKQGKVKNFTKIEPCPSFFNFFGSYDDSDFFKDMEEEQIDEIIEMDIETCETIRDTVIPNSLKYYLFVDEPSLEEMMQLMNFDGKGEDGEDDDDEDGEGGVKFDDPAVGKLDRRGGGGGGSGKDPDCQQQQQ